MKAGVVAFQVTAEKLLLKSHPKLGRLLTIINFGESAAIGYIAYRNSQL